MNLSRIFIPLVLLTALPATMIRGDDVGGMAQNYSGGITPDLASGRSNPIFLSGNVVLSDGSPPPDRVLIVLVCAHSSYPQGYTNSKGHFGFVAGQNPEAIGNQHQSSLENSVVNGLSNCEAEASLPGFRSDPVSLVTRRYMDDPDLGTIVLRPLGKVEGFTVSATSALAPKEAHKAYEKGLEAEKRLKNTDAQKEFQKAVGIYPRFAAAWFELGKLSELGERWDDARRAYSQASSADPKYLNPYERRYVLAVKQGNWPEVEDATSHLLRLNPFKLPAAYYYNAVANVKLNHLDAAEKSARKAVELESQHPNPQADYVLGIILLQKKNFVEAAEYLHAFLNAAPSAPNAEMVRRQLPDVERRAGISTAPPD